jgi:hypothetical protein
VPKGSRPKQKKRKIGTFFFPKGGLAVEIIQTILTQLHPSFFLHASTRFVKASIELLEMSQKYVESMLG